MKYQSHANQTALDTHAIINAVRDVIRNGVVGDFVEVGCNQGMTSVNIAEAMQDEGSTAKLYLYDSFAGLPKPTENDAELGSIIQGGELVTHPDIVLHRLRVNQLPDPIIVKGFVEKSIPAALPEKIAFALVDTDLYEPIMHSLKHIWERMDDGGICIVHDYKGTYWAGATRAADEFAELHELKIEHVGDRCARFVKGSARKAEDGNGKTDPGYTIVTKDMLHRPLSVLIAKFPYGGNGATASENPSVGDWVLQTIMKAKEDPRVSKMVYANFNDTPVTMTRNSAVVTALKENFDLLLMVDSDMWPDFELVQNRDYTQVPFWDTAFDFVYERFVSGPVCVAAPYCGRPPHENVFVFKWGTYETDNPNTDFKLCQYTREEASQMVGIHECAALPTGVILFDVRLFELTEPHPNDFAKRMEAWLSDYRGHVVNEDVIRSIANRCENERYIAEQSWFYYEYETNRETGKCYQDEKVSTEDVTATRDLSMIGSMKLGYNPVFCAWSSWAGHWKPKCVGKPKLLTTSEVGAKFKHAMDTGIDREYQWVELRQDELAKQEV